MNDHRDANDQPETEGAARRITGRPRGMADMPPPDPPGSPWRTLEAREVYRNPWFSVTEYDEIRPDGQPGIYAVVDPGDNATIVAVDDAGRVRLIGEFLYPLQSFEWGLPTGAVEPGEEPLAAAQRELVEEAGITAREWTLLGAYLLSPGIVRQTSYIYLARGLTLGEARPESTELITQRTLPLDDALEAVRRGEIRTAVAVIGIWRAWTELRGSGDRTG
jgi:8-oxo-dGTP pyrophosphatase MutT (NUDIX family)